MTGWDDFNYLLVWIDRVKRSGSLSQHVISISKARGSRMMGKRSRKTMPGCIEM